MFKQSTVWYIKIIKALHGLCQKIDYLLALSFKNYLQLRMALMYKPATWKIKKMFYYLQIIARRTRLSWAKCRLSSQGTEDKNLLNISLH